MPYTALMAATTTPRCAILGVL